jgi:hypothetical protein
LKFDARFLENEWRRDVLIEKPPTGQRNDEGEREKPFDESKKKSHDGTRVKEEKAERRSFPPRLSFDKKLIGEADIIVQNRSGCENALARSRVRCFEPSIEAILGWNDNREAAFPTFLMGIPSGKSFSETERLR